MDSAPSSPQIKWSPEKHLRTSFTQHQTASIDTHHEQKDIENDNTHNQASISPIPHQLINDENIDTNSPFHLTQHHLKENNKNLEIQGINIGDTPTTLQSSTISINSSNNNNYHHNIHRHRYIPTRPTSSRSRNKINDKLQRKLQKLEQDILSKNIQHDIMVNKEEMMAKRLKTKDIRIKNLQNDINKLRDQLTAKNESQERLVHEMTELQAQNRGLASKLRESNIGLNTSMSDEEANKYNESMRDILLNITNEIKCLKQQNQHKQSNQLIKDTVQSSLVLIVQQMKEQEREFMNGLKNEQSEWMNNISLQINENMNKHNNNELINIFCNKLDEMDKNNKPKLNNIYQHIKKQEMKLDSLNTNYFQTFFDENNKLITQKQQILSNELKQHIKREIYSTKTELISDIKKTKNELLSGIKKTKNEIDSNINKLSNNIKYPIPINNNNENINTDNINNINNNILSDIMNENALKITNLEESINKLCKNNKNTIKCIEQQIASQNYCQNNKFKAISDENTSKTTNTILELKPLFDKLYNYFQKTDNNVIQSIQQNNNDMIQSFAQFKLEFTKIIESININKQYSLLFKEIKTINENIHKTTDKSEINVISKNMQQITRRHDEIVKIITNSLPNSNKMREMYNNLSKDNDTSVVNEESIKIIKSMIISQIEEMKKSFTAVDNNLTIKLDKLVQEINSRNISLFNNIKQINDTQQKYIIKESNLNHKHVIKTHESALKNHLQQIQLRLSQLNKTQISLHKTMTESDENKTRIEEVINNKMETMLNNLSEIFDDKNELKKTSKDVQLYIRNDMMKEVQLIKHLCNDIHKKSQQLPHYVARNKDLKKFEQMFEDFTQNSNYSNKPVENIKNNRFGSINIFMIKLKNWCENILSQITNNRNNCSVYVIIYILSQIVFNTFVYPTDNEVDEKENDNDDLLSQMQLRGLSQLDNIYNNMENDEFDLEVVTENLIEWMQNILNNDNVCGLWITRTGHEMRHFCQKEFELNKKLINIKNKINQIIQKQSKTCWRMSMFQPLILCAPMLVVLFGVWLNFIQNQQNTYW